MWRGLFAAGLIYGFGHPSFDGYRPSLLDRPLQAFYQDVNQTARDGRKMLASLEDPRAMRSVRSYIAKIDSQIRSGD
jgi:hypothetical protein